MIIDKLSRYFICDSLQTFNKKVETFYFFCSLFKRMILRAVLEKTDVEIQHFSQQDIEILGEQTLYEGFFHA